MNGRLVELLEENQQLKEIVERQALDDISLSNLEKNSGCIYRNFQCDQMFEHIKTSLSFYKSFYIKSSALLHHQSEYCYNRPHRY